MGWEEGVGVSRAAAASAAAVWAWREPRMEEDRKEEETVWRDEVRVWGIEIAVEGGGAVGSDD